MKRIASLLILVLSLFLYSSCVSDSDSNAHVRAGTADLPVDHSFFDDLYDPQTIRYLEVEPDLRSKGCLSQTDALVLSSLFSLILNGEVNLTKLILPWRILNRYKEEIHSSRVINDTCYKQVVNSFGQSLVLFRFEKDGKEYIRARFNAHQNTDAPEKCLARAEKLIANMPTFAQSVLQQHKAQYPREWENPAIGPHFFLDCSEASDALFAKSVEVLLHELNHELGTEECIYSPFDTHKLCIENASALPSRGTARYETNDRFVKEQMESFQNIYIPRVPAPFLKLFDELNSYTISAATSLHFLKASAAHKEFLSFSDDEFLPHIALLCANYLNTVQRSDPELYAQSLARNTPNGRALHQLFDEAERIYPQWLRAHTDAGLEDPASALIWVKHYKPLRALLK